MSKKTGYSPLKERCFLLSIRLSTEDESIGEPFASKGEAVSGMLSDITCSMARRKGMSLLPEPIPPYLQPLPVLPKRRSRKVPPSCACAMNWGCGIPMNHLPPYFPLMGNQPWPHSGLR